MSWVFNEFIFTSLFTYLAYAKKITMYHLYLSLEIVLTSKWISPT